MVIGLINFISDSSNSNDINNNLYTLKKKSILISEASADNRSIISDSRGNWYDYIEIFNNSYEQISTKGWYITDSKSEQIDRWPLPELILKPTERVVIFASGEDVNSPLAAEYHTNFKIDAEGETLYLYHENELIQELFISAPLPNMVMGLSKLGDWGYFDMATPGSSNPENIIDDIDSFLDLYDIEFSEQSGIYSKPFDLSLSTEISDITIHFTTDSSEPTKSSQIYTGSISIDDLDGEITTYSQTENTTFPTQFGRSSSDNAFDIEFDNQQMATIIRARAFIGDIAIGPIYSRTYLVDSLGDERYSLPIISLVTDPNNLFNPETGIYQVGSEYLVTGIENGGTPALYNQRGREYERPVYFEYFNSSGSLLFAQDAGIRIFGGWTRSFPKKSFKLYARESYSSEDSFYYPFFLDSYSANGSLLSKFEHLVIRNGGNDWNNTIYRDVLMQSLVDDILDCQASQPIVLFLNGEYWGIYNIREAMNEEYIANHWNMKPEEVKIAGIGDIIERNEDDFPKLKQLFDFCKNNNLNDEDNWLYIEQQFDIENFINYFNAQIYFTNQDWPGNNMRFWRKKDGEIGNSMYGHDGRWRIMLYDTDFGFSLIKPDNYRTNMLMFALDDDGQDWPNPPTSTFLLRSFMDNSDFSRRFSLRMMDFLNSRFSAKSVSSQIEYFVNQYSPEIEENCYRWSSKSLPDKETWLSNGLDEHLDYALNRPDYIRSHYQRYFQHEDEAIIELSLSEGGSVVVNDQYQVLESQKLFYFSDQIIELEAVPFDNYTFIGWSGNLNSSSKKIVINGDIGSVSAIFFKNE